MLRAVTKSCPGVLITLVAFGQNPAPRPAFEVASIKRNTNDGPTDAAPRRSGDLVMMHNTQPYSLIYYAYHLHGSYQMLGYVRLPDGWNWYDIDARVGGYATDGQVRLMFQSLLEERFKLKVSRETRDIPEYELVIARDKPRLTLSGDKPMKVAMDGRTFAQSAGSCGTSSWRDGLHIICHAATMETIATEVGARLQAPVADGTGLTGTYDLNVRYAPDDRNFDTDVEAGPTLSDALREELGLKLEKGKGPVEVIVIEHMEKPSEN
jgi:uncharacterized protein (TIGR03435 family)